MDASAAHQRPPGLAWTHIADQRTALHLTGKGAGVSQRQRWIRIILICMALLAGVATVGCQSRQTFDQEVRDIVAPYRFSFLEWEVRHILGIEQPQPTAARSSGQDWDALEDALNAQIRQVLHEMGVCNPLDPYINLNVLFPPIWFNLTESPHLLIISPRDRIESIREVMLIQDLDPAVRDEIEQRVEVLGLSALVEPLGGFAGLYPSLVVQDASFPFIVETIVHEWFHQYLAFTPLGFRYILDVTGLAPDYEIATMNETVVSMVSKEVTQRVLERYYPAYAPKGDDQEAREPSPFSQHMRHTRLIVDALLADGQIEEAELFMEERRQELVSQGYQIRKLNQAYFAFYGTYADEPDSVSPIGRDLRKLRAECDSVTEFLHRAMRMPSREHLREAVEGIQ